MRRKRIFNIALLSLIVFSLVAPTILYNIPEAQANSTSDGSSEVIDNDNDRYVIHVIGDGQVFFPNKPEAIHFVGEHNRTYITYMSSDYKYIRILYYDHDTRSFSQVFTIAQSPVVDHHAAPAMLIDPQGYIHVFYGAFHSALYYIRSTNPEDTTSWTSPVALGDDITYPIVRYYNNTIYVFIRGGQINNNGQSYLYSTDGGVTWSNPITYVDPGSHYVYRMNIIVDQQGRFHFGFTLFENYEVRKHVYYFWSPDLQTFYSVNGTDLGSVVDLNELEAYCKVYDSSGDALWSYLPDMYMQAHVIDLAVDPNDRPIILYQRVLDGTGDGLLLYRLAVWNGTGWEHYDIAEAVAKYAWARGALEVTEDGVVHAYIIINGQLVHAYSSDYVNWSFETLTDAIDVLSVELVENYSPDAKLIMSYGFPYCGNTIAVVGKVLANSNSNESGWLTGWKYRKGHVIIGSTAGDVTEYQVRIVVHYDNGTDSGEHVYCDMMCKPDFGDVRFTANDGVTLLPYWVEEKVDGDYAVFWVRVPYIPAYPESTKIYIYYGNENATLASSGEDTFLFFDDFENTSLDANKWEVVYAYEGGGSVSVSNGVAVLTPDPGDYYGVMIKQKGYLPQPYNVEVVMRIKMEKHSSLLGKPCRYMQLGLADVTQFGSDITLLWYGKGYNWFVDTDRDGKLYELITDTSQFPSETINVTQIPVEGQWHRATMFYLSSGTVGVSLDNNLPTTVVSTGWLNASKGVAVSSGYISRGGSSIVYVDWVFVRKCVDPEPTVLIETSTPTPTPTGIFSTVLEQTSITVEPEEEFTIEATVTNNGDVSGTAEIRLKDHNGNIVDNQTITLGAGRSITIALSGTAPSTEGTYYWTVETYNVDNATIDDTDLLTVEVEERALFPWLPIELPSDMMTWIFILLAILVFLAFIKVLFDTVDDIIRDTKRFIRRKR